MRNRNQAYFDTVKALERMRVIARLLKKGEITEEEAVNMIEADDHFYKRVVEKEYVYPPVYGQWVSNPSSGITYSSVTDTSTNAVIVAKNIESFHGNL